MVCLPNEIPQFLQNILNVNKFNRYTFIDDQLDSSQKIDIENKIDNPEQWIKDNLKNQIISSNDIVNYFKNSSFNVVLKFIF